MHTVYYSPQYCAASYAFDTTRKAVWIADSLQTKPIEGIRLIEPDAATRDLLEAVHTGAYLQSLETGRPWSLASSQGFRWCPSLYPSVCSSTGGVVAACRDAVSFGVAGSLSSGLHHARASEGKGFCTINGLVVAARDAVRRGRRVMILDLDAHCGGGTASLICRDVRISQLDISVDAFDYYPGAVVADEPEEYLSILRRSLNRVPPDVDLVIYNAGMDVYERDCGHPGFDLKFIAEREATVFDWVHRRNIPIAYVLAGGYTSRRLDRASLVALHRCTLRAANSISLDQQELCPQ